MKNVTTDTTETQKIIGDYYEQLHANTLENLEQMGKFLETCKLQGWIWTESLNRLIIGRDTE